MTGCKRRGSDKIHGFPHHSLPFTDSFLTLPRRIGPEILGLLGNQGRGHEKKQILWEQIAAS